MIQFFINNIELVLNDDFSFTDIEENPLLTESGEYTLDFDISLKSSQNLKALGYLNRLNAIDTNTSFDTVKVVSGKRSLGKMIILSYDAGSAKCQFVSGNSEIVYLSGEDKKIWELDFGTEDTITPELAINSILNPNWENGYVCLPVKYNNLIANDYKFPTIVANNSTNPVTYNLRHSDGTMEIDALNLGDEIYIDGVDNINMNVYLMYYITKLFELFGYNLTENVLLLDERAKKMVLPNRANTLKYSDCLPDMTIRDFIQSIEVFFNVVFVFNSDKTALIVNTKSYLDSIPVLYDLAVTDDYLKDPYSEPNRFSFSKLSYELTESGIFRYQKIKEDIVENCDIIPKSTVSGLINELSETDKNKFKIFEIESTKNQFIFIDTPELNVYRRIVSATSGYLTHVNKFRNYFESDEKEMTLNVVPSNFTETEKVLSFTSQGGTAEYGCSCQMPVIDMDLYVPTNQSLIDAIENSMVSIPRATGIEVCLYNGLMYLPVLGTVYPYYFKAKYPISFIDNMPEFWIKTAEQNENIAQHASDYEVWILNKYKPVANLTMRIDSVGGVFSDYYNSKQIQINTEFIYTFYLQEKKPFNVRTKFYYNGRYYIPVKIERVRSNKPIKGQLVKAEFFAVK